MIVVETENLKKVYNQGEVFVNALNGVDIKVSKGEFVAIMGPSGCGKSTLLNLLGGLDKPTSGKIFIDGKDISKMNDDEITLMRRKKIGFVFQNFNLVSVLNTIDNVMLPLLLDGMNILKAKKEAALWLIKLGLGERIEHRPEQLSGGQQQRVAIARALAGNPALILADEPTGNLDTKTSQEVVGVLKQAAKEWERTVIIVTHDQSVANQTDRVIYLKDGMVVQEL